MSTAVSKFRTAVKVSTGTSAAKTVTAATKANPIVLTISTHGLAVGTVVTLSAFVGMTELNGMAGVITAQDTNSITLGGIDSTNFTAYVSGGSAVPQTMTLVANATNLTRSGEEADRFDATNMQSIRKEFVIGLAGDGTVSLPCHYDPTDTGQSRIRGLIGVDTAVAVQIVRSDSKSQVAMVKWTRDNEDFNDLHNYQIDGIVSIALARYA
jgi:hypothetical protein